MKLWSVVPKTVLSNIFCSLKVYYACIGIKIFKVFVFIWRNFSLPVPSPVIFLVHALTRLRKASTCKFIFGVLGYLREFLFKMVSLFFIAFKNSYILVQKYFLVPRGLGIREFLIRMISSFANVTKTLCLPCMPVMHKASKLSLRLPSNTD